MSQRILNANQRLVDAARDPLERVRRRQDRAVLLARMGQVDAAREVLELARAETPAHAAHPLLLRFEYVDAIQLYFAKRFVEARRALLDVTARARRAGDDMALNGECESALALLLQREGHLPAAARPARTE